MTPQSGTLTLPDSEVPWLKAYGRLLRHSGTMGRLSLRPSRDVSIIASYCTLHSAQQICQKQSSYFTNSKYTDIPCRISCCGIARFLVVTPRLPAVSCFRDSLSPLRGTNYALSFPSSLRVPSFWAKEHDRHTTVEAESRGSRAWSLRSWAIRACTCCSGEA